MSTAEPTQFQDALHSMIDELELGCMQLEPAGTHGHALIGLVSSVPGGGSCLVYSTAGTLGALMKSSGMDPDEAREFFDFNTAGAYISGGPVFLSVGLDDPSEEEDAGQAVVDLQILLEQCASDGETPPTVLPECMHHALLGQIGGACAPSGPTLLYSEDKILSHYMRLGMDLDEATDAYHLLRRHAELQPNPPYFMQVPYEFSEVAALVEQSKDAAQ